MNRYLLLADAVVVLHTASVAFVTTGFALIAIGIAMRWEWVRFLVSCGPSWSNRDRMRRVADGSRVSADDPRGDQLRAISGEASHSRDVIGYWVDRLTFYDFPSWVFTVAYALFGILVAIVFILAPPRWPGRRTAASAIPRARSSN